MTNTRTKFRSDGEFILRNADRISNLYFPLFNYFGMKASIAPDLGGDNKTDQNHFGLIPVSEIDLQNSPLSRNVFFRVGEDLWSTSGKTPMQKLSPDKVTLRAGMLYQEVVRKRPDFSVTITSFVPTIDQAVELHKITFVNLSDHPISVKATVAFPIYGRSADNIRDHRHVTSLLNRVYVVPHGIIDQPTLSFDERGHLENQTAYGVFAKSDLHKQVKDFWPTLSEFIGDGNDMFFPEAPRMDHRSPHHVGDHIDGKEALGGLGFSTILLEPKAKWSIVVAFLITGEASRIELDAKALLRPGKFEALLSENKAFWKRDLKMTTFQLGDPAFDGWLKWVSFQPLMRRLYGCSFLPHHDYGRGGRGWRDLWQDSLALILKDPQAVRDDLINNIAGVRADGSNATIIGMNKGEFLADRNNIVRIWSDHGAWPIGTIDSYIKRTGDTGVLWEKQSYFKDKFVAYTKQIDEAYQTSEGNRQRTQSGDIYFGSVLEHLLIENMVPFFNVGDHGNIRLEDADWNDGMDMASPLGETVAFTAMYAGNLGKLAALLEHLVTKENVHQVEVMSELAWLLNHESLRPFEKRARLQTYFQSVKHQVSGKTVSLPTKELIADLRRKQAFFADHLNQNEWIESNDHSMGWYNGYYDKEGVRLESADSATLKMTLTGQVFPLMAGIVPKHRLPLLLAAVKRNLRDETTGCLRLNTDFGVNKMNLGRFMGFAYGEKENGALFMHMAIMFANSLFAAGETKEGNELVRAIYAYTADIQRSDILPGIPEYVDADGRGKYHYLTGSASWVVLTFIDRIFGCSGEYGDLLIRPQLMSYHFASGLVNVPVMVNSYPVEVTFTNLDSLNVGEYWIESISINGVSHNVRSEAFIIKRHDVQKPMSVSVSLGRINQ